MDDRKSLSITFLAISDQYATFFFSKWVLVIWDLNGYGEYEFDRCICDKVMARTSVGVRRRRSHFSPFQINTQLFCYFTKWLPAAILDDRKSRLIAFLDISYQYATLIFLLAKWLLAAIVDDRKLLSITFLAISDQYATLFFHFFFFKMGSCNLGPQWLWRI